MAWGRFKHSKGKREGGKRSSLETKVSGDLAALGVAFEFEPINIPYIPKARTYTPDFLLLANYILVETKGWFKTEDRTKMLLVKQQYPDLDIRIVLSNPSSKIGKTSETTYGMWCELKGFPFAHKTIPEAWLKEPVNERSKAIILQLRKKK